MPTYIDQIGHQDVYNFGSCGLLHDQYSKPAIFLHQFKTDLSSKVFDVEEIKVVMDNVDILRVNIYWSMEASGWVKFSDACDQCCGNKNSKPPFSNQQFKADFYQT